MDLGLKGRVVIVTGSTSGIGRATAVAFGREGARVVVTYRHDNHAAEETANLVWEAGGEAMVVPYDLSDRGSIDAAVKSAVTKWGAVHVLVNNAMKWAGSRGGLFEEAEPAEWQGMIRTALEGPYHTIQAVLPSMREAGWGRIVNVSSSLAEDGMVGSGPYGAAKAGLHGLTRSLAWELGPAGILVNVVMPGLTLTERAPLVIPAEVREQVRSQTPSQRLSTPIDVAATILFLASEANGNINGEIVRITGGA